jgi:hypothetical protein
VLKQLAVEVGHWGNLDLHPANSSIAVHFNERADGPQWLADGPTSGSLDVERPSWTESALVAFAPPACDR